MSRWFRVYDDLVDDPKIQRLPDNLFRAVVNLWCLASKNGGVLPSVEDIAFKLRMKPLKVELILSGLVAAGLIDQNETELSPHNWNGRQFKSDVSTDRVKRFRERQPTVTETPPETESETDTESEKKDSRAVAKTTRPKAEEYFEEFWAVYPRREGANPKAPAKKIFLAAVKTGDNPQAIIDGARRCSEADKEKIGTPYIPQAVKWLRDKRWQDYAAAPSDIPPDIPPELHADYRNGWRPGMPTSAEIRARHGKDH